MDAPQFTRDCRVRASHSAWPGSLPSPPTRRPLTPGAGAPGGIGRVQAVHGILGLYCPNQQAPVAEGGNLIKWKWFSSYDRPPALEIKDKIILSWDTALSAKELSSYSVCVILQIRDETVFVLDVFRERLEYPDLKRKVIELHRRWRNATNDYALLIENKGSGMPLIQDLKHDNIHAIAFEPKDDKLMRMNAQTARIEAGSVYLPVRAPWLDEFRRSCWRFPRAATPIRSTPSRKASIMLSIASGGAKCQLATSVG